MFAFIRRSVPIVRGVPDVQTRLEHSGFESLVSRGPRVGFSPSLCAGSDSVSPSNAFKTCSILNENRAPNVTEIDDFLLEESLAPFLEEVCAPAVTSSERPSDLVCLQRQLFGARTTTGFSLECPGAEVACIFDWDDSSLYVLLGEEGEEADFAVSRRPSTVERCDSRGTVRTRTISSPSGTKASSFVSDPGEDSDGAVSDWSERSSAGSDEEDAMHAHITRSLALTLVDIAESLEAKKIRFLLDVGHSLFSDMFRTLLSVGFVVRSRGTKLVPSRRQQLLAFDLREDDIKKSKPNELPIKYRSRTVSLADIDENAQDLNAFAGNPSVGVPLPPDYEW